MPLRVFILVYSCRDIQEGELIESDLSSVTEHTLARNAIGSGDSANLYPHIHSAQSHALNVVEELSLILRPNDSRNSTLIEESITNLDEDGILCNVSFTELGLPIFFQEKC